MRKNKFKSLKYCACLSAVCASLVAFGTGCRTVYVDEQGRVIAVEDYRVKGVCDILNASGNFIGRAGTGIGRAATGIGNAVNGDDEREHTLLKLWMLDRLRDRR